RSASSLPQGSQLVVAHGQLALLLDKLLLGRLPQFAMRLDILGQFIALLAKTVEFRGNRGDLPVEVGNAAAAAVAGGRRGRDLAFQAADLVAQHANGPRLFELGRAMLLVL